MRFFFLGLIFKWPSLSFYSPFMLEEWFIVTYYLYLTLISILERKRDLCARMVSEKEQDVLLCFLLWGKQVLSIIGKGHRECYLRAHSLHLPWSNCAIYETGLGQSQPARPQSIGLEYKSALWMWFSHL